MLPSPEQLINQAQTAIDSGSKIVDISLSFLKQSCLQDNRVSATKLDDFQLVCYDLSYCTAEIAAAHSLVEYAQKIRAKKGHQDNLYLEERLALIFSAEILQNIRSRITARKADFGIKKEEVAQFLDGAEVQDFIDANLATAKLVELGKLLVELDGQTGDYLLDQEKELMRNSFKQFATDVVMPLAEEIHRKDLIIPDEILNPLTELGCFGLSVPMKYGGLKPDDAEDTLGMIVVTEELSRGSLGGAGSIITRPEIMARALLQGGTEEQKEYWLPRLVESNPFCAIAVTEPDYGSDVANIKLKAEKTKGGWLVNGAKTWCTFAGKAGVLFTLARTNPDMSLGHKGLSIFLIEKPSTNGHEFEHKQASGGTIVGKAIPTIGYRGMHSFDIAFENYFVPDSHLLGGPEGEGKGFYFTMGGFSGGRIQTAARANGVMQAAYEEAVKYSNIREVFGKPLSHYQLTLVKIAKMATLLNASRHFTYAVGRLMDKGQGQMEASLVKFFACKSSEWICREALQLHGGMGYAEETPVSRYFLDSRVLSIFEGAEETLALKLIARSLVENAK